MLPIFQLRIMTSGMHLIDIAQNPRAELHARPGAQSLPESKPKSWSGHRAHREGAVGQ
jgi:hypothetical protein